MSASTADSAALVGESEEAQQARHELGHHRQLQQRPQILAGLGHAGQAATALTTTAAAAAAAASG